MRLLAPLSYAFDIFVGRWRLWLAVAWLPALGLVVALLLNRAATLCFRAHGNACYADWLPYGASQVLASWTWWLIFALYGLCFIPAVTALYRHLLLGTGARRPWRLEISRAELRYAGWHLLLFYADMILQRSFWFWLWPRFLQERERFPHVPPWFIDYFGHPVACLVVLLMLLLLARFYLVLPDAALGRRGRFLDLLAHSRGQVLAIVLALVVVRILSILAGMAVELPAESVIGLVSDVSEGTASALETLVWRGASFLDDYVRMVGSVAVLAWFYRHLVMSRQG